MIRITLFLGISLIIFMSCKGEKSVPQQNQDQQDMTIIRVKKGESFTIPLESSYGNGYQWELEMPVNGKMIQLDSSSVTQSQKSTDSKPMEEGNQAFENFHFSVKKKGETTLHFQQVRVWEKKKPLNRRKFQIIAQ